MSDNILTISNKSSTCNTSSPSSPYEHRGSPASFSVRIDADKANQSFIGLSQSCESRSLQRSFADDYSQDWTNLPEMGPVHAFPARSANSLVPTVNLYHSDYTPTKRPPSSPLYYDYTEDFEIKQFGEFEPVKYSSSLPLLPKGLFLRIRR